jgi:hypothetical protein
MPTPTPRVYLLGTGTCRSDPAHGQAGACFIHDTTTFIFDVGAGSLERLERVGAFERCHDLHIHLSHRHTDHAIGIFPLLQCLTYSDDARHLAVQRVTIHATEEVCALIKEVRALWGEVETCLATPYPGCEVRHLEYKPGPDLQDWRYLVAGIEIESVHLPDSNNHGIRFAAGGVRYALTGDATVPNEALKAFCGDTDVCVFDFGHITNRRLPDNRFEIDLSAAIDLVAHSNARTMYASHVYLRHFQDRHLSSAERAHETARLIQQTAEEARARGFQGELLHAKDCQAI